MLAASDLVGSANGLACQFSLDGVGVECVVGDDALTNWAGALAPVGLGPVRRLASRIANYQLRSARAKPGERWVVLIRGSKAVCRRVVVGAN
jgi:hypothetical protein